jgi:hypothetical protein
MDTAQIICTLRNVDSFLGLFPSDLLPRSITRCSTLIVNTDPHTEKGSHWLAINFRTKSFSAFYFDSYGLFPYLYPIQSLLRLSCSVWDLNTTQLQVSSVRSAGTTAVCLPCTWIGDILLIILSAYFIPTLLTARLNRCSKPNLDRYAYDRVGVSAAPVATRGTTRTLRGEHVCT